MPLDYSILFFLQLTVILASCKVVGWIAKYLGQPVVVGEMIAGVLLGPSLLGLFWPELHGQVFPREKMPTLFALSQLGLALYMFVVGIEFELEHFRKNSRTAIVVSLVGMVVPFILGGGIAFWLYGLGDFFSQKTRLYEAILFMGASMSITAFPMLARIIHENRLTGTSLGTLTLAAGAIDDVAAWCILALVLSFSTGDFTGFLTTVCSGVVYTLFVLIILKPMLFRLTPTAEKHGYVTRGQLVLVLGLLMLGACCTNAMGIHAVFGAFILGCAMPRGIVSASLVKQIEPLTLCLLVPLFFAYSGLNTRLDLVSTPWLLLVSLVVLLAACIGKGVACWGAARWSGESQGMSMAIGCLMNARGMMGLILLIIGKESGIIGPELFSILVLTAILTTLVTTPLFRWIQARYAI